MCLLINMYLVLFCLELPTKTNENKTDPLRAVNILTRKAMGHTAVSATEASSVTLNLAT